jgi:hypothetical protein
MALMAYVLGAWRLLSDMSMAGQFVITGLFSHWQVWIAVAVLLHLSASMLNRYGRGDEVHLPRMLTFRISSPRPEDGAIHGTVVSSGKTPRIRS